MEGEAGARWRTEIEQRTERVVVKKSLKRWEEIVREGRNRAERRCTYVVLYTRATVVADVRFEAFPNTAAMIGPSGPRRRCFTAVSITRGRYR